MDAWEAYDRHVPVLCTLQRATNLGLQREDSWSLWGFNYANEYTRHGVRSPGAAYKNASTHAHVCLLWSCLSINDLQGYNFESLKPHFFSAAARLSSARSSGVHIILLFFSTSTGTSYLIFALFQRLSVRVRGGSMAYRHGLGVFTRYHKASNPSQGCTWYSGLSAEL